MSSKKTTGKGTRPQLITKGFQPTGGSVQGGHQPTKSGSPPNPPTKGSGGKK